MIMAKGIMDIDDSSFETEVVQSDKPAVVDFWAPWCGPCKAIGPVIEELAGSYGEQIKFTKCNVDDNPVTPGKFGIKAIPTLIFFMTFDSGPFRCVVSTSSPRIAKMAVGQIVRVI